MANDTSSSIKSKDSHIHGNEKFPVAAYWVLDPPLRRGSGAGFVNLPPHWHDEAEIFYMISGSCAFFIDGNEYALRDGDAVFVRPRALHHARLKSREKAAVSVSVAFDLDFIYGKTNDITSSLYLPKIFGGALPDPTLRRAVGWQAEALDDFLGIVDCFDCEGCRADASEHTDMTLRLRGDNDGSELRIKSLFCDIFYLFTKNSAQSDRGSGADKSAYNCLLSSVLYLHEHYNEKLTLAELAARALMSEGHYSRVFAKYMGCSPFRYLIAYRINRSISLIVNTDMRIIDIASECGFSNVSYYNRRFRELMHCTPTEYRHMSRSSSG